MADSRKSVVISGASTGIGAACALDLAKHGFRVFAGVRDPDDGRRLEQLGNGAIQALPLDVTTAADIAAAAAAVEKAVGPQGLWGLVNNAGIAVIGPLELVPIEDLRQQLEVNLIGHVAMIQAMLPWLRVARGRIVNIGSFNGFMSPPYFAPYAASKYAMEAITDSLRVELRTWGIGVSIVEPRSTDTPIWRKSGDISARMSSSVSAERMQLYEKDLKAVRDTAEKLAKTAMPVRRVTWAVRHALSVTRPRTRYPVGLEARLAMRLARLLPDFVRDWLVMRGLGLQ